jgi:cyclic beta-1,2-glucan synthetase
VYDLALQAVAHGDGRLGRGTLTRFVASYQTVKVLQLGELWAIPIMLRLALIENLRRVAARVDASRSERGVAGQWADRMFAVVDSDPKSLILVVADMARSEPPLTAPFISELARRLHGRSAALELPLRWAEQCLAESHQTIDQLVQLEAQRQAAAQVSVSNSIGSLRLLGSMDWREFVETLSRVEQVLREDPAGVYAQMDFGTRDAYRHAVERIASRSQASEVDVARAAIDLALHGRGQRAAAAAPREGHVGHHLVGDGRPALDRLMQVRVNAWGRWRARVAQRPLAWYGGAIVGSTLALAALPVWVASAGFTLPLAAPGVAALATAALLLVASQLAVTLVNGAASRLTLPRSLPRMDFAHGIPPESRTLVVVPTMLGSAQGIDALAEALEVRFLANRDAQLRFALLTDLRDAAQASSPADLPLLQQARERIEQLNAKYGGAGTAGDRFFLLHRARLWNPREGVWMGHERKRGKLADLNALLRGGPDRFSLIVGDRAQLAGVRYVITLDTDTQLPRDAAAQFVATMAHPLNRPVIGGAVGSLRVVQGHGILQPRVGISLATSNRSRYGRLSAGETGIDPYTRAVSDVYQDLFDEGSFIGKGIYDVDAFEQVLGGRLPDDTVLSHDLLEGGYARSGLLSDVELIEESPTRHDADVQRRHRWIRGDWQLLGWLLPQLRLRLPGSERSIVVPNPLSALARWKIADNLRRSLVPAALTLLFVLGWALLESPALWTLTGLAVLFVPAGVGVIGDLLHKPEHVRTSPHWAAVMPSLLRQLGQAGVALATLPHEAWYSLDAIGRTLWRLAISRRHLLEWQPSSDAADSRPRTGVGDLLHTARTLAIGPLTAVATVAGLSMLRPAALGPAAAVLLLWFFSPLIIWWLDRPLQRRQSALNDAQTALLRRLTRRTWAFFETYVVAADNHLPPDNVQEHPVPRVAHRTSPTNIGLSLLATLSAHDFGYIGTGQMIERITATLDTLDRLDKHHGHLLNWYDTQTLQPLRPAYVSTVDSGNLAGHLLTLRAGLLALADTAPPFERLLAGLSDTLDLWREASGGQPRGAPGSRMAALLLTHLAGPPPDPSAWAAAVAELRDCAVELQGPGPGIDAVLPDEGTAHEADTETRRWARALLGQCDAARGRVQALSPARHEGTGVEARHLVVDGPCRARSDIEDAGRSGRCAGRDGLRLPLRPRPRPAGHRLQRRRPAARRRLLRPAGVRGAPGLLRRHRPRAAAAGELVRARPPAGHAQRRAVLLSWTGSMFEYLMPMLVMPELREHPARPDGAWRGAAPGAVRPAARRSLGHLRVGLQRLRRRPELPVPRLRRPGPRPQTRAGRRPGGGALCHGDGADGRPARGRAEPAAPGRRRAGRPLRLLRGHRLHGDAAAARRDERRRAVLHGPPPGHGPAGAGPPAARPPDAAALRVGPRTAGHAAAAAGARAQGRALPPAPGRQRGDPQRPARRADTAARDRHARHAIARGAAAVQRALPRDAQQRRCRLQPLEGPGGDTLERGRHEGRLGQFLLPARRRDRHLLVDHAPADAVEVRPVRGHLQRGPRRVPAPRPGHRRVHRSGGLARGRHRAAPAAPEQPRPHAPPHRADQLRRGRAGAGRRGRAAPGLQQAVRADRGARRAGGDPVLAPCARGRGGRALDVPLHGGARRRGRPGVARDRPRPLHRPRPQPARPAGAARRGHRLSGSCRLGAGPGGGHAPHRSRWSPGRPRSSTSSTARRTRARPAWR